MGYNRRLRGKNDRKASWRGYYRSEHQQRDFYRGFYYGKRAVFRGILRCVEIAIMVAALAVILQGVDRVDTLPVTAVRN